MMIRAIERFSIESHKTKTRVITTTNRKKRKYPLRDLKVNPTKLPKARENAEERLVL